MVASPRYTQLIDHFLKKEERLFCRFSRLFGCKIHRECSQKVETKNKNKNIKKERKRKKQKTKKPLKAATVFSILNVHCYIATIYTLLWMFLPLPFTKSSTLCEDKNLAFASHQPPSLEKVKENKLAKWKWRFLCSRVAVFFRLISSILCTHKKHLLTLLHFGRPPPPLSLFCPPLVYSIRVYSGKKNENENLMLS